MRKILHLEDGPEDAILIENTIREAGIDANITVVRGRAEFLAALEQSRFDIILSDHGLRDIDSATAIKMATDQWPEVWFICVSGTEDPEEIQKCLNAGAAAYISKNNLPKLIAILGAMLGKGQK
jgi:CheY-like chemotaxis protein